MNEDDHDIWLTEARELLIAARAERHKLKPALRQMCRRAFRDFQFPPSLVLDYLVASTPSLFGGAGFSDDEVDALMPTLDRVVSDEWAARRAR
jgi:hypothetical protein